MGASTCANVLKVLSGALSRVEEKALQPGTYHARGEDHHLLPLSRHAARGRTAPHRNKEKTSQGVDQKAGEQNKRIHFLFWNIHNTNNKSTHHQLSAPSVGPRLTFHIAPHHRTLSFFFVPSAILCECVHTRKRTQTHAVWHKEKSRGMQGNGTEC